MTNLAKKNDQSIVAMDDEQLPIPQHRLHGSSHFLGLYAAEHVAASEWSAYRQCACHIELLAHHGTNRGKNPVKSLHLS